MVIQIYLATEELQIEDFVRQFSSNVQKEMPKYLTVGNSTFAGPEDVDGYISITEQFSFPPWPRKFHASASTNKSNSTTTSFLSFARFLMKMRISSLLDSIK